MPGATREHYFLGCRGRSNFKVFNYERMSYGQKDQKRGVTETIRRSVNYRGHLTIQIFAKSITVLSRFYTQYRGGIAPG